MIGTNAKKVLAIVLTGLLAVVLVCGIPVTADDETSVDAEVEVLPEAGFSYGAKVVESRNTWFRAGALGEPDGRGAYIFWRGWVSIELEDNVINASMVSIWAAKNGWQSSNMEIYVSSDGRNWKQAGEEKVISSDFLRYDFTGSFGDVKYIRVDRSGGLWSWLLLDAVGAKGGDTGKKEVDIKKRR